jgi:DNA-binding NarL/FixJ family response regulator
MSDPIKVFVVEDHRMFADAIELLLATMDGIASMGSVTTAEEALERCRAACPDVVLMDIDLPGMDGIEATPRILEICPEARIVAITALQPDQVLARAIEAGAVGFVPKTQAADHLVEVIRRAAAGEIVLPSGDIVSTLIRLRDARRVRRDTDALFGRLTDREVEILQTIARGKSTFEIAEQLFISPHTVQSHVRSILTKLGARTKLEAVLFALRHGVVRFPSTGTSQPA